MIDKRTVSALHTPTRDTVSRHEDVTVAMQTFKLSFIYQLLPCDYQQCKMLTNYNSMWHHEVFMHYIYR